MTGDWLTGQGEMKEPRSALHWMKEPRSALHWIHALLMLTCPCIHAADHTIFWT